MVDSTLGNCTSEQFETSMVVKNNEGNDVGKVIRVEGNKILLTVTPVATTEFPIVATTFISSNTDPQMVKDAAEAMAGILEENPLDPNSTQTYSEINSLSDQAFYAATDRATSSASLLIGSYFSANLAAAIGRPSFVSVPSNYIYNPRATVDRTLHDYYSYSKDDFSYSVQVQGHTNQSIKADFRGPCAIHDMCIENARRVGSLADKRAQRAHCDSVFKSNMTQNCNYAFYENRSTSARGACYGQVSTYYSVVSAATKNWDGK